MNLNNKNLVQLKQRAVKLNLKNISRTNKANLIKKIIQADKIKKKMNNSPAKVRRSINIAMNIMRIDLSQIKDFKINRNNKITLIRKNNKRISFDMG